MLRASRTGREDGIKLYARTALIGPIERILIPGKPGLIRYGVPRLVR